MKVCVITGASGLIGSEMVREFLAQGFAVTGIDLRPNPELEHPEYTFVKADISHETQVKRALSKLRTIKVLINNGAKADPYNTPLEKLSLREWNKFVSTNLTSVFLLSKHALPLLKKSEGSIINISSTRHLMSEPNSEIYSTAKGGIDALTRAMAISLDGKVRVNSISPGWIADPKEKLRKVDHEQHPVKRVGRPSDVAKMALYLASDAAGFITGQDFVVDGGMTVKMIYEE
ncbi:MAG: SDR family NAD(P)-dependent oxidoreductase [Bacteriovoracaceae bacterium]